MNPQTRELTKNIVAKVCLSDDVLKVMGQQLGNGAFGAVQSQEFQN